MSWLDQLQRASFRNVRFHVDTIEHSAGDNTVLREYPFQDLPTVFRLGEAAEEIKFSAYVIGHDYIEQRDALRRVLSGPGELVHPTAGTLRVFALGKYQIKENPKLEGGMARFDLTFVRAEPRRYPVGVVATRTRAELAATAVSSSAARGFAAEFDLAGQIGWVREQLVRTVREVMGEIQAVISQVSALAAPAGFISPSSAASGAAATSAPASAPASQAQQEEQLNASLNQDWASATIARQQQLATRLDALMAQPAALATELVALMQLPPYTSGAQAQAIGQRFQKLFDLAPNIVLKEYEVSQWPAPGVLALFGQGKPEALQIDSTARRSLALQTGTLVQLVETLATAAYAQACARTELASYEQALELRSTLSAQCNKLLIQVSRSNAPASLAPEQWHDAVVGLQSAGLADLMARSKRLTRLQSYTPLDCVPIWVISHRLFGTAARADELLAMNPHIQHPLLVPAGKALRVPLSEGSAR